MASAGSPERPDDVAAKAHVDRSGVSSASNVLEVHDLRKQFRRQGGELVPAIDGVSLTVASSEFVVLLGPSGCGKTTLLRAVAGLEIPDSGTIRVSDRLVYSSDQRINVPAEKRRISMIFQSYALWPHMTVFENVAYPLRMRRIQKAEIRDRVQAALKAVGLPDLSKQHPGRLSGGQQQRVALARAIVAQDKLILFDEPLSNVDAKVREHLRSELIATQAELGFAALYVTHDQQEAMELADRVAVVGSGRIAQLGTPRDIYDRPASRTVAEFVGRLNRIPGTVVDASAESPVRVSTPLGDIRGTARAPLVEGQRCIIGIRPELVTVSSMLEPERTDRQATVLTGTVIREVFAGPSVEYLVDLGGDVHVSAVRVRPLHGADTRVRVTLAHDDCLVLPELDSPT